MLSAWSKVQERSLLVRRESSRTPTINRELRMHPNPNNDGGQKRTPGPNVHTSLQHLAMPTHFHQKDGPNPAPSFPHPTLTTVDYYTQNAQQYAPSTGSYSHHPSLKLDSSHSSTYHHRTSALQSLRPAHTISPSSQWPEAGSTVQPQYQMDSTDGRYEEDSALWHSFLNESGVPPFAGPGRPSELVTSVAGEPIQCVLLAVNSPNLF